MAERDPLGECFFKINLIWACYCSFLCVYSYMMTTCGGALVMYPSKYARLACVKQNMGIWQPKKERKKVELWKKKILIKSIFRRYEKFEE